MPRPTRRAAALLLLLLQPASLLLAAPAPATPGTTPLAVTAIQSAVLRVEVATAHREWDAPWKLAAPTTSGGTAFVIAGNRLLTNAHVVRDAQQITVKKSDGSAPALATVDAVDEECDLAVLRVADKTFLSGLHALPFGELPAVGSSVTIYGYPLGGHEMSTTAGVVSRIEAQMYLEGFTTHLAGQTDAAINPGNSGGPVVQGGSVVGVAFQNLTQGQTIGYFIPAPVVRHFLGDLADGTYAGFPDAQFVAMPLESPAMRRERGLPDDRSGVVVQGILTGSDLKGVLVPDDVLMAVDGERISDDGTFASGATRLPMSHLVDMKSVGQKVRFTVWRDGKVVNVDWKASRYAPLDRMRRTRATPRYLVYGGVLFLPLTIEYLAAAKPAKEWRAAMFQALEAQMWGPADQVNRELIVQAKVFRDPVNLGIEQTEVIVERVNGQPVRDLADLAHRLDESHQKRDVFEVSTPYHSLEAIDHERATAGRASLLAAQGIVNDRSL